MAKRILGDAWPFAKETFTRTNIRKYTADPPLRSSALIGAVTIETVAATD